MLDSKPLSIFPRRVTTSWSDKSAAGEIDAIARQLDALRADAGRGRLIREGVQVVFAGRPNAGKSSLFNRLAGAGRAIVTDLPGTTRDLLTEVVEIDGVPVTLVDTAGLRETAGDAIEAEGIARAVAARTVAAVVVGCARSVSSDLPRRSLAAGAH